MTGGGPQWWTRPGGEPPDLGGDAAQQLSATLLFHKWHRYDAKEDPPGALTRELEASHSRVPFLEAVARCVNARLAGGAPAYHEWCRRYAAALDRLGVGWKAAPRATTLWRLLVGGATNPAWETGLTLHPLHAFPYLPGSAVKGLVHHQAEAQLLAGDERRAWAASSDVPGERPGTDQLAAFLEGCERVKRVFGSLSVANGPFVAADDRPRAARSLLRLWRPGLEDEPRARVDRLLDEHASGAARFYDAVPDPSNLPSKLVELDLINPHYPDYYNAGNQGDDTVPAPSDDQDPKPVPFLAVAAGVPFVFPVRSSGPSAVAGDDDLLHDWLHKALSERGAGAKTAAGYGYFQIDRRTSA